MFFAICESATPFYTGRQSVAPPCAGIERCVEWKQVAPSTKASLGGEKSWQPVGLTEEGHRSTFFIKGALNGTRQSVGADTSRPQRTGIELSIE